MQQAVFVGITENNSMAIANQSDSKPILESARLHVAVALVLFGLYLAAFGNSWGPIVFEMLPASEIGTWLELIVPFLPMVFIGFGATLFGLCHRSRKTRRKLRTLTNS